MPALFLSICSLSLNITSEIMQTFTELPEATDSLHGFHRHPSPSIKMRILLKAAPVLWNGKNLGKHKSIRNMKEH